MSEKMLAEILSWSVEDRLQLIDEVWNSIAVEADALPLSDELRQELDRRLADYEANPDDVATWDEVKARLQAQP